jgi:hypothetical protein
MADKQSNTEGLGVWFPKAKLNAPSTAAELVEHHPGRARVHVVVPIEPAHRIGTAIHVVDKIITDHDRGVILGPIYVQGPTSLRSIVRVIFAVRGNVRA